MFDKKIILPEYDIVAIRKEPNTSDEMTIKNDISRQRRNFTLVGEKDSISKSKITIPALQKLDDNDISIACPIKKVTITTKEMITRDEPANSTPGGAYYINPGTAYIDTISGAGVRRWYYFQLTDQKKISIYMSPENDSTIDNDIALYSLDTTTGQLTLIAESQKPAAQYELLSHVADAGYYFFCVVGYAGTTTNQFTFLASLSSSWDENEGDDNPLQAIAQPLNTPVSHTLDSSLDEDWSILGVSTAGNYAISLYGVPSTLNYQLQIMNTDLQTLMVINANSVNVGSVAVGAYILRVVSTDGVVDPDAEFKVLVTSIPSTVNISTNYKFWLSDDNKHVVEAMTANNSSYGVAIDGEAFDYTNIDFETTRASHNNSVSQSGCSMSITASSYIKYAGFCSFYGSGEPRAVNLQNAFVIELNSGVYGETHSKKTYNISELAGASNVVQSIDQYGTPYYVGYWNYAGAFDNPVIIINLDTGEVADSMHPNWYFGSYSYAGYGRCAYADTPTLSRDANRQIGTWTTPIEI